MTRRMERVNELLRGEVSNVVLWEIRDPRVSPLLSITGVDTSSDLRHARVYVSVMAPSDEQGEALRALRSASGFIRRALHRRLHIRRIPDLAFELDTTIEEGEQMLHLIDRVVSRRPSAGGPPLPGSVGPASGQDDG